MAEPPRRLDLRLTISGTAPYRDLAVELAVKFAEFAGASQAAAQALSTRVGAAVASRTASAPVDLRLSAVDGELSVTAAPPAD